MLKEKIKLELLSKRIIVPSPDGRFQDCWKWTGKCSEGGYGIITIKGYGYATHRMSAWIYELKDPENVLFTFPSYYCVLHKCDNPPCNNWEHLFIGTQLENNTDRDSKGRNGLMKDGIYLNAKLTETDVLEIRRSFKEGVSKQDLMIKYNVAYDTITKIVLRRAWKYL